MFIQIYNRCIKVGQCLHTATFSILAFISTSCTTSSVLELQAGYAEDEVVLVLVKVIHFLLSNQIRLHQEHDFSSVLKLQAGYAEDEVGMHPVGGKDSIS